MELSSKAIQNEFGMKKAQYDAAVKELIAKGYLVDENAKHPPEDVRNYYGFYQLPQPQEKEEQPKENKQTTKNTTTPKSSNPDEIQNASLLRIMERLNTQREPEDFDFG